MKHNPITRSKCIHKERGRRTGDTRPRAQLSEATAAIAGSLLHPEIMISGELRLYLWNLLFCIQCRYSIPVQPHVPRRAKVNMGYRKKKGGQEEPELSCPFGVMVERGCHRGGAGLRGASLGGRRNGRGRDRGSGFSGSRGRHAFSAEPLVRRLDVLGRCGLALLSRRRHHRVTELFRLHGSPELVKRAPGEAEGALRVRLVVDGGSDPAVHVVPRTEGRLHAAVGPKDARVHFHALRHVALRGARHSVGHALHVQMALLLQHLHLGPVHAFDKERAGGVLLLLCGLVGGVVKAGEGGAGGGRDRRRKALIAMVCARRARHQTNKNSDSFVKER